MAVLRFVRHWRWLEEEIVERSTHLITAFQFRHTVHTRTYTHTLAQNNITNNSLTSTLICNTHAHKYVDKHGRRRTLRALKDVRSVFSTLAN